MAFDRRELWIGPIDWRRRAFKLRRAAREERYPVEARTLLLLADDCDEIAARLDPAQAA